MPDLIDGRTVVTTAGTRVPLSASSVGIQSIVITAETDNTGVVVVGAPTTVVAALLTRRGHPLAAGVPVTLTSRDHGISDLNDIGLDSMVSGDGVTWIAGPSA